MFMAIFAFLNQKGGVGKTTTAVTIASALARQNYATLLIDLDSQGNVADSLGLETGDDPICGCHWRGSSRPVDARIWM
jgi:chromosome partitioning protein